MIRIPSFSLARPVYGSPRIPQDGLEVSSFDLRETQLMSHYSEERKSNMMPHAGVTHIGERATLAGCFMSTWIVGTI